MMDAEMYGMIPRPKIVAWLIWLALKIVALFSRSAQPPAAPPLHCSSIFF